MECSEDWIIVLQKLLFGDSRWTQDEKNELWEHYLESTIKVREVR